MRIAIGADHAGVELKAFLIDRLTQDGHQVLDAGANGQQSVDYPDFALKVAVAVLRGKAERGIMLGGSGQGEAIAPNKIPGIRAAVCHETYSARMSREHNDANVLAMGSRVVGQELAWDVVHTWLITPFSGDERHVKRLAKVHALEQKGRFPLIELDTLGQSIWYDNIHRGMLLNGEFRALVRQGVLGVTSNPSIFEKAIGSGGVYDADLLRLTASGAHAEAVAEALMVADIQEACDQLAPIYQLTGGRDGFVSLELPPALSHDAPGSYAKATGLHAKVNRPNLMIKVPGTPAGTQAFGELITAGIPVNVTLLFSVDAYEAVAHAYVAAIERRAHAGEPLGGPSGASFFVSRIDTLADSLIEVRLQDETDPARHTALQALLGEVAIANAKVAAQRAAAIYGDSRWQALAAQGAQPQRLLWASTSAKNPAYRDVVYVEELIGPDTVNTLPDATLKAYIDHGFARLSLAEDEAAAAATIASLATLGIDYAALTEKLLVDGVKQFADAYDAMVRSIATKQQELQPAATGR